MGAVIVVQKANAFEQVSIYPVSGTEEMQRIRDDLVPELRREVLSAAHALLSTCLVAML